ncbi:MAG: prepilin-type N-terminal cleavage/methylation domain-containing protein [candidate division Zixibacteria bacterium]|nr:prepilin-type N-terminal cleavage/methylation domain-containing protein [candidate division Zixibacteria bacterium]
MTDRGFTLIELVMIIVVLGILAAIAVPRMGGLTESSRVTATNAEMAMLKRAIVGNPQVSGGGQYLDVGFEGNVGSPPTRLEDLAVKPDSLSAYNSFTRLGWNGPYIDSSGSSYLVDAWNAPYRYDPATRTIASVGGSDTLIVAF